MSEPRAKNGENKSPALYITMLILWTVLTIFLWANFLPKFVNTPFLEGKSLSLAVKIGARVLLVFNAVFISYFWLNGVKDFLYVIWYYCARKHLQNKYKKVIETDVSSARDKILLAYCTCNDFDGVSLEKSMKQTYPHFDGDRLAAFYALFDDLLRQVRF